MENLLFIDKVNYLKEDIRNIEWIEKSNLCFANHLVIMSTILSNSINIEE